jgi:uncharacterized protein
VLTEIRPDGSEMYLTAGWLRASRRVLDDEATALRPRPSYEAADRALLPTDGPELVRVEVFPFGHVVREGSRIRVTVEEPGGNRPIWRFDDLVPGGADVTNTIVHDAEHPSRVVLPIVSGVDVDVPAGVASCVGSGGQTTVRGQPCRVQP